MNSMPADSRAALISTKLDVRLGGIPSRARYRFIVRLLATCANRRDPPLRTPGRDRTLQTRPRASVGVEFAGATEASS
jgi:hypothetical protein